MFFNKKITSDNNIYTLFFYEKKRIYNCSLQLPHGSNSRANH
jgi:hypothetical protein